MKKIPDKVYRFESFKEREKFLQHLENKGYHVGRPRCTKDFYSIILANRRGYPRVGIVARYRDNQIEEDRIYTKDEDIIRLVLGFKLNRKWY